MSNLEAKTGEVMPKEAVPTAEDKRLRTLTRGWVTDDKLAILRDQFRDITVSTAKGYKECVKAIGVVRKYRTTLEKSRIEKNRKEQENISDRNKEARRITAILVGIETPLKKMKLEEDERVAKEKAEKERVEKERVDAIKQRIEDNFGKLQIEDLAGKPSAYITARIRIIEAFEVDDSYQEFVPEAEFLKEQLLESISRIFAAKRQQEKADKKLLAERAKLDAEKQKMAAEAKRLEEQQEAFEKERAAWNEKRKAEEEAEAETGQADEEEPAQEPTEDGAGGAEAQEEAQGGQVTDEYTTERLGFNVESVTGPQFHDEPEDEETVYPDDELSAESKEALASFFNRTNREKLVELIQEETGIKEFKDEDLTDLLDLAGGMYLDKKFEGPIRYLAGQVRKELELYEGMPE